MSFGNNADPVMRPVITIASGESISNEIDVTALGLRGISVMLHTAGWTTADLLIYGQVLDGNGDAVGDFVPLRTSAGALVRISGITTDILGIFAAPAEAWSLGVVNKIRFHSVAAGGTSAVNQGAARSLLLLCAR